VIGFSHKRISGRGSDALCRYAYAGESDKDPAKYYRNNVAGTLTLLETMRITGCDIHCFELDRRFGDPAVLMIDFLGKNNM